MDGPKVITKNLIEDSWCPGRDSNQVLSDANRMNELELPELPYLRCEDSGRRCPCYA
jgi:hypothetical protein